MKPTQHEIIETLNVQSEIDPLAEIERRVTFLCEYAAQIPSVNGFVLGISGGQDSTLAGRLVQLASERLRERGREATFVAVRLPYRHQQDEADAQLALDFIQPDRQVSVNIASAVDALTSEVAEAMGAPVTDFTKGNSKARMRMIVQYTIAGDLGLLVVGSDHAAEAVTGFFTKFGDGAADMMPLSGLTKSQGAAMLRELGAPERLWQKLPTADLLDDTPGEADETSLGLTYAEIDAYLMGDHLSVLAETNLQQRFQTSEHKRRLPVVPRDTWWRE